MDIFQIVINLFFAFIGAYLSVLLSMLLKQNGKVLEKMDERTQETHRILEKMDERAEQRHKEIMMKS